MPTAVVAGALLLGCMAHERGEVRPLLPTRDAPLPVLADPAWERVSSMSVARERHASFVLDGKWVMVGGNSGATAETLAYPTLIEAFDPLTGRWSAVEPPLSKGIVMASAVSDEASGRMAIVGGSPAGGFGAVAEAEIGPPSSRSVSRLHTPRFGHSLTFVGGELLAAGGWSPDLSSSAEVYDSSGRWSTAGVMPGGGRAYHTSTALRDAPQALVVGGTRANAMVAATDVFDFSTRSWRAAGQLQNPRAAHRAERLPDGRVMVSGGADLTRVLSSVEIYDPASDRWTPGRPMRVPRYRHVMLSLSDGRILVAGGSGSLSEIERGALSSVEIYDPIADTWTDAPSLSDERVYATGAVMNGDVFIGGGINGRGPLSSVERLRLPPLLSPSAGRPVETDAGVDAESAGAVEDARGCGCHEAGRAGPEPTGAALASLLAGGVALLRTRRTPRSSRRTRSSGRSRSQT